MIYIESTLNADIPRRLVYLISIVEYLFLVSPELIWIGISFYEAIGTDDVLTTNIHNTFHLFSLLAFYYFFVRTHLAGVVILCFLKLVKIVLAVVTLMLSDPTGYEAEQIYKERKKFLIVVFSTLPLAYCVSVCASIRKLNRIKKTLDRSVVLSQIPRGTTSQQATTPSVTHVSLEESRRSSARSRTSSTHCSPRKSLTQQSPRGFLEFGRNMNEDLTPVFSNSSSRSNTPTPTKFWHNSPSRVFGSSPSTTTPRSRSLPSEAESDDYDKIDYECVIENETLTKAAARNLRSRFTKSGNVENTEEPRGSGSRSHSSGSRSHSLGSQFEHPPGNYEFFENDDVFDTNASPSSTSNVHVYENWNNGKNEKQENRIQTVAHRRRKSKRDFKKKDVHRMTTIVEQHREAEYKEILFCPEKCKEKSDKEDHSSDSRDKEDDSEK